VQCTRCPGMPSCLSAAAGARTCEEHGAGDPSGEQDINPLLTAALVVAGRYGLGTRLPVLKEVPPLPSSLRTSPWPPWFELPWRRVSPPGLGKRRSWFSGAPCDWSTPTRKIGCPLLPPPPARPPVSRAASRSARLRGSAYSVPADLSGSTITPFREPAAGAAVRAGSSAVSAASLTGPR
jgi:hypothetical protein